MATVIAHTPLAIHAVPLSEFHLADLPVPRAEITIRAALPTAICT